MNVTLHNVQRQAMGFVRPAGFYAEYDANDYRCFTDLVSAERLVTVEQISSHKLDVLTDILAEVTWNFWQSYSSHPVDQLRQVTHELIRQTGA
jgi:hypothetical protein